MTYQERIDAHLNEYLNEVLRISDEYVNNLSQDMEKGRARYNRRIKIMERLLKNDNDNKE